MSDQNKQTVIETKLPLPWLIGCAAAIIFSLGGLYVKVDSLINTFDKINERLEKQNDSFNTVNQNVLILGGRVDSISVKTDANTKDIDSLKQDLDIYLRGARVND